MALLDDIQDLKDLRDQDLALLKTYLTQQTSLSGQILTVTTSAQTSFTITGPDGSRSVDRNGYLNSLNNNLNALANAADRCIERVKQYNDQLQSLELFEDIQRMV